MWSGWNPLKLKLIITFKNLDPHPQKACVWTFTCGPLWLPFAPVDVFVELLLPFSSYTHLNPFSSVAGERLSHFALLIANKVYLHGTSDKSFYLFGVQPSLLPHSYYFHTYGWFLRLWQIKFSLCVQPDQMKVCKQHKSCLKWWAVLLLMGRQQCLGQAGYWGVSFLFFPFLIFFLTFLCFLLFL